MKKLIKYVITFLFSFLFSINGFSNKTEDRAIENLRKYYSTHSASFIHVRCNPDLLNSYLALLNSDGYFDDYKKYGDELISKNILKNPSYAKQQEMGDVFKKIFLRLWTVADYKLV